MGHAEERDKFVYIHRRKVTSGFSLLEVLVGLLVAGIVTFALFELFNAQQNAYFVQDEVSEMQQNLRIALERISTDLTMAGFGKATPTNSSINNEDLSGWFNSATNPTWQPVGAGAILEILGSSQTNDGTVATMNGSGPVTITLKEPAATVAKAFNTSDRKDITISGMESARISAIAGNILTVSPLGPSTSLSSHQAGTEIYVLKHITYSTGISNAIPVLYINEHRGAGAQQLSQYVTSLNAAVKGKTVVVTITGRTRNRDRTTSNYITSSLSTTVVLRNP
jgi:type II secretory pathway pseudopilin PulG